MLSDQEHSVLNKFGKGRIINKDEQASSLWDSLGTDKLMPLGVPKKERNKQGFLNFLDYRTFFKEHPATQMLQ